MQQTELAQRIRTVSQLADIVQALRALASARRRQAQERFTGLERYAQATRASLRQALALLGEPAAAAGAVEGAVHVVVLFSEHGFVGALNDRLLDFARTAATGDGVLVAVGARGKRLCDERGVAARDGGAMPTTATAADATAQRLTEDWFGEIGAGRVREVRVVFARHEPPLGWQPRCLVLFPPEVEAAEQNPSFRPIHTLDVHELVARAIEEYAFAQVSWAVGEAFASEQAARFVAMEASHRHIEDKLQELRAFERQLRQETTTNEILEIVSGSGSLRGAP